MITIDTTKAMDRSLPRRIWRQLLRARVRLSHPLLAQCHVRGRPIVLSLTSEIELGRALTYATKEPDTLDWIDSLPSGSVLYDVGANVGLYTLYAAARGLQVYAFEPEALNFTRLLVNLSLNRWTIQPTAVLLALSDRQTVGQFNVSAAVAGSSLHSLSAPEVPVLGAIWEYRLPTMTLDALWEQECLQRPTHLKLDVDGFERQILAGGTQTLLGLASLMVEVNGPEPLSLPPHLRLRSQRLQAPNSINHRYEIE